MAEESSRIGSSRRTERWSMRPIALRAPLLLCGLFLGSVLWAGSAVAGSAAEGITALSTGRAALERGDLEAALKSFEHAADALAGSAHQADRIAALAGVGQLRATTGDSRGALLAWTEALPLADALVKGGEPGNAELGVFVRLQLVELLRADDPAASEQFAWDAVQEAVATNHLEATAAPVSAVLAAAEDEAGVRERLVELDEVLAPLERYRLHPLPRPQPLGALVHDVARSYAEAGLTAEARRRFGLSVRVWLALNTDDLAARALVDLGRAAMENDELRLASDALNAAEVLSADDARLAGSAEVSAWLRSRSGDPQGALRVWSRLSEAEPVGTARHGSLIAHAARESSGARAIELHEQAAAAFRRAASPTLALVELVAGANRAARMPDGTPALRRLLGATGDALAGDEAVVIPQSAIATRELAVAELALRDGKVAEARLALTEAGSIFFRIGATDAVAYAVSRFVDAAIAEGDFEAAEAAGENAVGLESDLGLAIDGWRALASQARLHSARGLTEAADRSWGVVAVRVERLASLGQLERTEGVPGPVEAVYGPWIELLLAARRVPEAFAVAQRASSLGRGLVLDGRMPGSELPGGFAQLRAEVGPVRDRLAMVSTQPGAEDPAEQRQILGEQLAEIYGRWSEFVRLQREHMPRSARREVVSSCEVAEIAARLPDGAVLYDEHQFPGGSVGFVLAGDAVLALRPSGPVSQPARAALQRARHVVSSGAVEVPVRLAAGVPVTRALLSCDLLEVDLPAGDLPPRLRAVRSPRESAEELVTRALSGTLAGPVPQSEGLTIQVDEGEPTRVTLDSFAEAAVVWVHPADRAEVGQAVTKVDTLDELRRRLRRANVPISVWLSPPAR
jgi:hypothetical protein